MSNSNSSILQPPFPLAIDETGQPIPLPSDAASWRVRRHTGGRPHTVLGGDRKPLVLPLDYSAEELLRLVGRGSYRLDLCDEAGQHLETVAITLGDPEPEHRNRAPVDDEPPVALPVLPTTSSETRLVLEANVRATQMAFQHNERTLTASLKMAETLRDGVQVLAASQADWIKAMASARGFFRNAAPIALQVPAVEPKSPTTDEDDGGEEGEPVDDSTEHVDKTGVIMSFGAEVMKFVNGMAGFGPAGKSVNIRNIGKQLGIDIGALLDWRKAAPTAIVPSSDAAQRAQDPQVSTSPSAPLSLPQVFEVYSALPTDVRTKLDAVRAALSQREQQLLMVVLRNNSPEQLRAVAIELASGGVDEAVATIRARLAPYANAATENNVEQSAA